MTKIRTIKGIVSELKAMDASSAITENLIRSLCRSGALKHIKSGNKYLISLDDVVEFFENRTG